MSFLSKHFLSHLSHWIFLYKEILEDDVSAGKASRELAVKVWDLALGVSNFGFPFPVDVSSETFVEAMVELLHNDENRLLLEETCRLL